MEAGEVSDLGEMIEVIRRESCKNHSAKQHRTHRRVIEGKYDGYDLIPENNEEEALDCEEADKEEDGDKKDDTDIGCVD